MALATQLKRLDFKGKTIYPFSTHEGSGLGDSLKDLKKYCPNATIKDGLAIQGSKVYQASEIVKKWLSKQ